MTKCNLFGQITLPPTRTQADDAAFQLGSGNGKSKMRTFDQRMTKILKNHAIDQNLIQTRKKMTKCNLFGQITLPPTRTQADDAAFPPGSGNGKNKSLCF